MLAVEFTFPGGRYHATPWERHVNEGAVAWPPEPWRILRALIATWHHKVAHTGSFALSTLDGLVKSLSMELPEYVLPAASHSHTRHYMPQFATGKTSLVFDAFAAIDPAAPLMVVWPAVQLRNEQTALLDELLANLGYLGRAESWVEACRAELTLDAPGARKCVPGADALDPETGALKGDIVTLLAPLPEPDYQAFRDGFLADKKARKKLGGTLPDTLLDALSVDTGALRKQGWSQPPAARKVNYLRPIGALRPTRVARAATQTTLTTAQFMLIGKPLPRVEDSVRIGELMRMAVMGQANRVLGEDQIPAVFSGHGLAEDNRHGHAFYLPWDADGDGRIDRVLVHVPLGMDETQRRVVEKLNRMWSRDGGTWRLVLESMSNASACALFDSSTCWQSVTPYLHPWYRKKHFDAEEQISRECRERGLPEPVRIERINEVLVGRRYRRPGHFRRFRHRRGLTQPDRNGGFWRLSFHEPVNGPLALGFACHFGLGLLAPVGE